MSDLSSLLAPIRARAEGVTDLCPEYLRQSIRHVQRNCDIECNVHVDESTWDDCKQPDRYDGARMAEVLASIPRLLSALDAVDKLAEQWHARGEHDMAFSKTIQDEDIAMELLTHGAGMVENARHIRNAVTAALGEQA